MKKTIFLFVIFGFAAVLAGCNLPGAGTTTPTTAVETQVIPATLPPPTAIETTTVPPTAMLPAATTEPAPTRAPGPAVNIEQITMLDTNNGWGWASQNGNMNILLRTTDGGKTWMDVSPQGEHVYAGGYFLNDQAAWLPVYDSNTNNGGMLRTTNGGKTWESLPPNEIFRNAWVKFSSQNDGVAETMGVGAGNAYINYYETHDGGTTWTPILITQPRPEEGLPPGTVHLCNICGDTLYFDSSRAMIIHGNLANEPTGKVEISFSTDLGRTWKNLSLPFPDAKYAGGVVAPLSPAFFGEQGILPVNLMKYGQDGGLAFSVLAVYTTQDGGQTWKAAPSTLENIGYQISSVQILSPQTAVVRCGSNLCATGDGAQTWRTLPDSLNFDQAAGGPDYVSQFSFIDPMNGWAISGETGATTLWRSTDGGATWTKLSPALAH